ncbi:MAG: substrate-binding domain-containing protein [Leptolinea sp.]|jgi:ribose transport system substrate-binding protein|nr:substrate-binding domain-containing protein [Leptolinea sp.]
MESRKSLSLRWIVFSLICVSMLLAACAPAATPAAAPAPAEKTEAPAVAAPAEAAPSAPAAAEPATGKKNYTICQLNASLAEPWNVQMDEDIKAAAAKYPNKDFPDVTVTVQYKDAQNDVLRQRAQLEECVLAKVDAIIAGPIEAGPMTDPIAKAVDAGIPVFLVGRGVNGDKYTQYIGSDEFKLSYAETQWVVKNYGGKKAKVVYLQGLMTSSPAQERFAGFKKALEGSDIEVIFTADAKWDESAARSEMESALSRFDKIDVVVGANDPSAHGAYLAAKAAGREKEMVFVGIDGLKHEGQAYVQQGIFAMTIIDRTGGDIGLDNVVKYLNGKDIGEKTFYKKAILLDKDGQIEIDIPDSVKK